MGTLSRAGLVMIGLLIGLILVGAIGTFTATQTVLAAGFVTDAANEADAYSTAESALVEIAVDEIEGIDTAEIPTEAINTTAVVDSAIQETYIQNQSERLVRAGVGYLNGDRGTLNLTVNTQPLITDASAAAADAVRNVDLAVLVRDVTAEEIGTTATGVDVPVSGETLARMLEGPEEYRTVRQETRDEIRQTVIDQVIGDRTDREVLASAGVPDEQIKALSQAEREQLVEETIADATNINEQIADQRRAVRDEVAEIIRTETDRRTANYEANITQPAVELQLAVLDGIVTDQPYEQFTNRVENAQADIADEAEQVIQAEIESNLDTRVDLTDELSAENRDQIDQGAEITQLLPTAGVGLLGAIGLLTLIAFVISRSVPATATTTGSGLLGGGGLAALATTQDGRLTGPIERTFSEFNDEDVPVETAETFALIVVDGVSDQLLTYSLLAGVVGGVLVGAVVVRQIVFGVGDES
ncbi:MAG: hypothetical protein J07HX5_01085 [halophilic archaeon J07HX5]|jgi:hypothetical protein|nr:MAG: hypothetical protein J07HX5_01085 [halophilic archaeon J07HX5]